MLILFITLSGALFVTTVVHELGHLLAARYFGVRVMTFSIGFGPELYGFTDRLGTRWRLAALPLGGSVGLLDEPAVLSARSGGICEVPAAAKLFIIIAGPAFNFLFAGALGCYELPFLGEQAIRGFNFESPDVTFVSTVGALSILMGAFSMIPMPPLDGGKLLFIIIEAATAKPIPTNVQMLFAKSGVFVLYVVSIGMLVRLIAELVIFV